MAWSRRFDAGGPRAGRSRGDAVGGKASAAAPGAATIAARAVGQADPALR